MPECGIALVTSGIRCKPRNILGNGDYLKIGRRWSSVLQNGSSKREYIERRTICEKQWLATDASLPKSTITLQKQSFDPYGTELSGLLLKHRIYNEA